MHYYCIPLIFTSQQNLFLRKSALIFNLEQLIVFFEKFEHLSVSAYTMDGYCPIHQEANFQLSDEKMILRRFIIDLQHLFSIIDPYFSNCEQLVALKQLNQILFPQFILFLILEVVRMNTKRGDY